METLKISQLKEGCIYLCNVSDRKVLITSITPETVEIPNGEKFDIVNVGAISYSGNGMYDSVCVWDNMLSLLPN